MGQVIYAAEADDDVAAIAEFTVETWGQRQADRYLDMLEARLALVADQPRLGPGRPDLGDDIRAFPAQSHVIYYRPTENGIYVLRVLHYAMDPARQVKESGQDQQGDET